MTEFRLKDNRRGDEVFSLVTREYWKKVIVIQDRSGQPFRTGTEYHRGEPVKFLTLLRRADA